ncbi:S1 family peptidase [Gigaspora margarita]|uniref:S1 family peptidase n=1 Tax=Gigaspora margarita TaxID=4874 RepID=A0A8H4EU19_GIGMA|nr:S1 family peptidase [Gigaspora margarita]
MKRQTTVKRQTLVTEVFCGDGLISTAQFLCSAGFFAKDLNDPSTIYVVTAGHCHIPNISEYFYHLAWDQQFATVFIGPMVKYSINPYDYGLISLRGTSRRQIKARPLVRNTDSNICKELPIHDTTQVSSHGAHLCKSGHQSHATCGYVKGFNGIFKNNMTLEPDLIITNTLSLAGDSGGTAYFYEDLCSVSLSGIISAASDVGLLAITPLEIILREADIELIINS